MADPVVLVTGAGGAAGRNVIASLRLSTRHYRIIGADCDGRFLQTCGADEYFVVPRADAPGYEASLRLLCDEHQVLLLHPQPDPEVRVLARASGLPVYLPPPDVVDVASDKERTAAALRSAGVPVPRTHPVGNDFAEAWAELVTASGEVWVRARTGAGSRASLSTRTFEEAQAWIAYWSARGIAAEEFMASEMLPGREFAVQMLWWNGELIAAQGRERLEYLFGFLSPSGQSSSPSVARIHNGAEEYETAAAAVLALAERPHGIFSVDMKQDALGRSRVTEVNAGRFFTTSLFLSTAGVNFPDLLVRLVRGEGVVLPGTGPIPESSDVWIRSVDMAPALVSYLDAPPAR